MARPRTFDEHDVVTTARRRFTETGYHGTSVGDLSAATGLSKGSLYGAFGDKEALFRRVFEEYCAAADQSAAARVEGPEDEALDRLRDWLHSPDDVVGGDNGSRHPGCLLAKGTAELAWTDEAVAARSRATFQVLFDSCRQLIEQAQRAGHVNPTADPAVLGQLVVATHRGLEALTEAGVDAGTLNRIADAAIDNLTPGSRRR
ncbi:TetR/AcrR family transcriptional regulator [Kineococcus radiotolerans]|uniref:Transcriptional regulator, TetR family n=1 Tax=Kineococcus radiotolerans (strain ATCC BAA-149 / DSM 14245 / SRS30216) TaxID=266940 RepID=A6WA33_KINRD|nr:TetR/AcrR family transcriptional regulator [Kineococcus radiotolerans]ABS03672.1 transcriptional regulator, TetR family [Kineococcus radiotolerans SRS30216 = ATCC BAA-149]